MRPLLPASWAIVAAKLASDLAQSGMEQIPIPSRTLPGPTFFGLRRVLQGESAVHQETLLAFSASHGETQITNEVSKRNRISIVFA